MVLDAFLLGATGYAAIQYSTNAEAFLQAVRQACTSAKSHWEAQVACTMVICRVTKCGTEAQRAGRAAQVAGAKAQSGLDVVDKAQSAVNLVKVIGALNQISDMLRARPAAA